MRLLFKLNILECVKPFAYLRLLFKLNVLEHVEPFAYLLNVFLRNGDSCYGPD